MPYFFFSYAAADTDGYLDQFYADLCDEVRARTGYRADDIGFRDRTSLHLGMEWPTRLAEAIASSAALVALCSPSYFASEMCGKEWQLFTEIDRSRRRSGAAQAPALLPVLWIPSGHPPEVARHLQHSHESLGAVYRKEGAHHLARLRRYSDDYRLVVIRLAERIVAAARPFPPRGPAAVPDFASTPNAFETPGPATATTSAGTPAGAPAGSPARAPSAGTPPAVRPVVMPGPAPPPSLSGGPRHVNFVVVAAPSHEVSQVRSDTQYYGPTPQEWAPYKPVEPQRICVFAQRVASTRDLTSALRPAGPAIAELLARAREQNEIVVLLVDVWTTKLDPYHGWMVEYDERNAPTSAVMVPWNRADKEMQARGDELRDDLRRAFPNNTTRADTVFRPAIGSLAEFREALEAVLAETQARIFALGTVARRATGSASAAVRPILRSPDES